MTMADDLRSSMFKKNPIATEGGVRWVKQKGDAKLQQGWGCAPLALNRKSVNGVKLTVQEHTWSTPQAR